MTPTAPIKRLRVGTADNVRNSFDRLGRFLDRNLETHGFDWICAGDFLGEIINGADLTPTESEYTNARYWIQTDSIVNTVVTGDQISLEADPGIESYYEVVTATNLSEATNSSHLLPVGQYVHVFRIIIDRGTPVELFYFESGGIGGFFPVLVTKTGGSDGTSSSTASWTYGVTDQAANSLGTALPQIRPRPNGKMTYQSAGSIGVGYYTTAGAFALWDAGEVPTTDACT